MSRNKEAATAREIAVRAEESAAAARRGTDDSYNRGRIDAFEQVAEEARARAERLDGGAR